MFIVSSEYNLTVSFEDLDPMNMVWHGNYIRYMEQARCDLFSKLNYTYIDMKNDGIVYPIVKMKTKYIRPARFGDKLAVETEIISIEPALEISYTIKRCGEKIFKAETMQIAADINTFESIYTPPVRLAKILEGRVNEKIEPYNFNNAV